MYATNPGKIFSDLIEIVSPLYIVFHPNSLSLEVSAGIFGSNFDIIFVCILIDSPRVVEIFLMRPSSDS